MYFEIKINFVQWKLKIGIQIKHLLFDHLRVINKWI